MFSKKSIFFHLSDLFNLFNFWKKREQIKKGTSSISAPMPRV
jgi:hypothetical protein